MGEELADELHRARLGDLGEDVGQLGERGRARGQALERALDAAGDLLEALVGEALQLLAGGLAGLRMLGAEDVDERVDDPRALVLTEERGEAHEAEGALVLVLQGEGGLDGGGDGLEELGRGEAGQLVVDSAHGALGVEELGEGSVDVLAGRHAILGTNGPHGEQPWRSRQRWGLR